MGDHDNHEGGHLTACRHVPIHQHLARRLVDSEALLVALRKGRVVVL